MDRRSFNIALGAAAAASWLAPPARARSYGGPNVILVRFGGGCVAPKP
jgi:hypothetical protein